MINRIINWSIHNRSLVLLLAALLSASGILALRSIPLDAIPDLSDVQVIIKTPYPGQAPQIVEDQVTYPLTSAMLSVPGATSVRGYSFFGDSYVYVIFDDGTDPYWARTRVLEYLNQVTGQLPEGVQPTLGPDASGVGWVYQYALVDRNHRHDLAELRSLQDWFLKYELQTLPGVAEVATLGGMVKQYQVVIDPGQMQVSNLTLQGIRKAILDANNEVSGSVIEFGETEYMLRGRGYISDIRDLENVPYVRKRLSGNSLVLSDIADIRTGPQLRRGVADLDGEGEVVGGIVVMRWGENARTTIERVKQKLAELQQGLPEGVEIVETYNRASLIERAVNTLQSRLLEEFLLVVIVCALFLVHLRSAVVILVTLPIGILCAFIIMRLQGINANIMSLGGIAIAIGAMVDAAIVMIENVHKHMEENPSGGNRIAAIKTALNEVGAPLFFSLVIITISFLPVFTLQAQEGRLFSPLAYTKTYAMAAAAILSITLVPALLVYLIRGRIMAEGNNPVNRLMLRAYHPLVDWALRKPWQVIALAALLVASTLWPYVKMGAEFMPQLNEGDLLYMPSTLPGLSIGKARELLQQTDRLIKTVPEVVRVFGKAGRADTATDPAPLTMMETTIQLKPQDQWREGLDIQGLIEELDSIVQVPGVTNAWLMPISARIDMLATGIKTPVGVKIAGPDLRVIESIGQDIERLLKSMPGTHSVYSERVGGAHYVDFTIDRDLAAQYDLSVREIQDYISMAIGGANIAYTVEGRERYPINMRFPLSYRDSPEKLKRLPVFAPGRETLRLEDIATITIKDGPAVIKTENARLNGWVYLDIRGRDIGSYVKEARAMLAEKLSLPSGYTISWAGQYQYMQRAKERLAYIVPVTLILIVILLYLNFNNMTSAMMVISSLPLALVGGFWLLYLLDYNLSVAVAVGFIALAGVTAEFGVVMLVYLEQSVRERRPSSHTELRDAVIEGALSRVRPKVMTVAVIISGLLPIMLGEGAGSEVMARIAAPMLGGMLTAPLVSMVLIPALYYLWKSRELSMGRLRP